MADDKCTDPVEAVRACATDLECDVGTLQSIDYVISDLIESVEPMPGQDDLMGALVSMSTILHEHLKKADEHVNALYAAIRATRGAA